MGMTCLFAGTESHDTVDVDKTWHLLHYLLTGRAEGGQWPLSFILREVTPAEGADTSEDDWPDEDSGGTTYSPDQVREIAVALAELTPERARARWPGPTAEAEAVYLYEAGGDDEALEAAMAYYGELRDLVLRLAARGEGLSLSVF
jgi:hypothetical protein